MMITNGGMKYIMALNKKIYDILGETETYKCKNCSHERPFKYVKESTWVTFFSIQLFPYKERNLMICPVCSAGFEAKGDVKYEKKDILPEDQLLKQRESVRKKIKAKLESGEINHNEYIRLLNILKFDT